MRKVRSIFRSKNKTSVPNSENTRNNQESGAEVNANKSPNRNDGSNEGTKRSSTPLFADNTPIRELWKVAYEKLKEEDGALIKHYETELQKSVAGSLMQNLPVETNKRDQMEAILRIKLDEINKNASSLRFKAELDDFTQLFLKVVDSANDYISDAASANPYTSIAWTGVSFALPLLLNPSEQREALAKGLDYVASLITQSRMREELYIECYESGKGRYEKFRHSHGQYKTALEKLYRQILRFQVTVYCYYTKASALRFAQDSMKWNSWEQLTNEVRNQESNFTAIEGQWRHIQRHEERLAAELLQHANINVISGQVSESQKALEMEKKKANEEKKKEYEGLLRWLCDIDHSSMYRSIRNRYETGTNEWLMRDNEAFKTWETGHKSLLWLHGKAGSGKSVLTSSVIKYLQDQYPSTSSPSTALAYFYFSFSDPKKQEVDGMLASLLKQICSHLDEEFLFMQHFRGHKTRGDRPETQTLEQMLFKSTLGFSNVYLVIDALDECPLLDDRRRNLLKSLGRILINAPENLHIFLTSRKEQDIEKKLRTLLSPPLRTEIDLLAHQTTLNRDICHYIDLKLATEDFNDWPESIKEEVKKSLVEKADCMFQYVHFQFEGLQKLSSTPKIRQALQSLPTGLDATYDRILQSIDSDFQGQVIGSLKWLAFSKRTLKLEELSEVFTIFTAISNDAVFDEAERPFSSMDILKYFSGLIVTHNSESRANDLSRCTVRLVHFSLKEYLTSKRVLKSSTSMFSFNEVDGHLSIVRSCLVYLKHLSSQYAKGIPLKVSYGSHRSSHSYYLADYLGNYWMVHLEEILHESAEIIQEAIPLLAARSQSLLTLLRLVQFFGYQESEENFLSRPYCYTTLLGLRRLTEFLISQRVNKYITQDDLGRALSIAADEGNMDMMQLLLESGASPNVMSLENAMSQGDLNALELLEEHGAIINSHSNNKSLLMSSDEKVIKYLLDRGADINMHDEQGETALHRAVSKGDERTVKLLLERGANVNAVHEYWGTPLQAACSHTENYTTRYIKMLLDGGADPNVRGGEFGTALQAACATSEGDGNSADLRMQNVRLLIDHGADVNIQGGRYGTALHALARVMEPGTAQLVKLLLHKGAEVDQLSNAGLGTALHIACYKSMVETVRVLLDHGADVNAAGGKFDTPLQAAVTFSPGFSYREKKLWNKDVSEFRLETVQLLIQRGAKINQKGRRYGTALHAAYANPDVNEELLNLLLKHGADVTAEGGYYGTILVAACRNPEIDLESVHRLLDRGVDANAKGGEGGTALIAACSHEHSRLDLVRVLIDRGADVNAKGGEYGTALIAACSHDYVHLELVQLLIDHGADVNAKNAKGRTALISACRPRPYRLKEVISSAKLLLEGGADVNAEDKDGEAPLMLACQRRENLELVELLLENGANVFHQDCAAWYEALQRACLLGAEKEVLPMLKLFYDYHIDFNHLHKQHGTALNAIVKFWGLYRHERELHPCIRWLLDHGAELNIIGGDLGFPLQAACSYSSNLKWIGDINFTSGKTKLLLEQCPDIDVNAQGGRFGSALQAASFSGQTESVKLLIDKKANVNAAGGKYGSALSAAIISGHWDIVEILLQAGATPDSHLQRQPDEEWLEEIRKEYKDNSRRDESELEQAQKEYKQRAIERYKKFWEVQGMPSLHM